MDENQYEAAKYRRYQSEKLWELKATKDSADRQTLRLQADFYGRQADEYEAKAKAALDAKPRIPPSGSR